MGKARSYEIIEYREKIMNIVINSPEIIKLFGFDDEDEAKSTIPYHYMFPHEYIPDVVESTHRFINFEIGANIDSKNHTFKDLTIYFYIFCHQDVVNYKDQGRKYLWYDRVVCVLDDIFNENDKIGIGGKMDLVSNIPYYPEKKFKGRLLKFVVKDFYNGLKYGK